MSKKLETSEKFKNREPLKFEDLDTDLQDRIHVIREEFIRGFNLIRQHKHSVTFFGSARLEEGSKYYEKARRIAKCLAEEEIDVVTGGGPGIMEAANRGAAEAETGKSLGLNISLPMEQTLNPYVEKNEAFHYFFSRKVALTFSAEAYLVFPGGFGTLDELFEILTLVQTKKIVPVPVILVGSEFWQPLVQFIKDTLLEEYETISPEDISLFSLIDDEDDVVDIVKEAPMRKE